uniref:Protein UL49 n=1 Tax=Lemniscomys rat herpesvirus TaxID=3141920 RepID=A0AAU7E0D2_9VIRU
MSFLRHLRDLFSPLCRHDGTYHLRLVFAGVEGERPEEHSCVLDLFVTGKKFLARDLTDRLYCEFLEHWGSVDNGRDVINAAFNRLLMTRPFFILLGYLYMIWCLERLSGTVSCLYLQGSMWESARVRLFQYPHQRLEGLLENVTLQGLSDLHYFLFAFPFCLPLPNQMSSPCMSLLRAREYDVECDIPVFSRRGGFCRHTREEGLLRCLRAHAKPAVCGNPLYVMAKVLVERFCRRTPRFLVPLKSRSLRNVVRLRLTEGERNDISRKTRDLSRITLCAISTSLRHGLISSLIDLPVLCYCKVKCERYRREGSLLAVVCRNCGHCLNLGKDKLEGGNSFALNCMFYYRDRQEKSVIYSTHNDTVHCSLCGSQYLSIEQTYRIENYAVVGFPISSVNWRAVIGSNTACGVFGPDSRFDALVPCSSRSCYGTVVLRSVGIERLLRLVSHGSEFCCGLCQNVYRETCSDQEGCREPCVGCDLYERFGCPSFRVDGRDV